MPYFLDKNSVFRETRFVSKVHLRFHSVHNNDSSVSYQPIAKGQTVFSHYQDVSPDCCDIYVYLIAVTSTYTYRCIPVENSRSGAIYADRGTPCLGLALVLHYFHPYMGLRQRKVT